MGDESRQNLEWETLIKIYVPQILSCFKISNTRLLVFECYNLHIEFTVAKNCMNFGRVVFEICERTNKQTNR